MTQPKTQPIKPSTGAEEAARKIWRKQYPNLPSIDAATVQSYALIIDREIGVAELSGLLEAARHADVWFDWFYEGKPSTLLRPTANRLKQAITKCESGTGSE